MDKQLLEEAMFCLSDRRMTYQYFKDKYCMFLLDHFIQDRISINELKRSRWAQFCHKPVVKEWLAKLGSKQVDKDMIAYLWQTQVHHFTLSIGQWGGQNMYWQQTCRKGYNLVIQLNFTRSHDRCYEQVIEPGRQPFSYFSHPISEQRNTLAWARLDISEDFSEVLIEEIQNDWLRLAKRKLNCIDDNTSAETLNRMGIKTDVEKFLLYCETELKPLEKIWDEAMLCATLEFIQQQIGAPDVYMYDHETGAALKSINHSRPPKSLYTRLPKKFGFKQTTEAPSFIQNDRLASKKLKKYSKSKVPQWHHMNFKPEKKYA